MKPTTALKRELPSYSEGVSKSLAHAVLATQEPDREARVYCRDADELILALDCVRNTCDSLNTLDWEKSTQEVKRTGSIVLELRNGSAIVFLLETRQPVAKAG